MNTHPPPPGSRYATETEWQHRHDLLEWACAFIRTTGAPLPSERWWHLAVLAFLEEAQWFPFYAFYSFPEEAHAHLLHAQARFPEESRLKLAGGVIDESSVGHFISFPIAHGYSPDWHVRVVEAAGPPVSAELLPTGDLPRKYSTDRRDKYMSSAVRTFGSLLNDPDVGPESHLHLGTIELTLDQPDLALTHFDAAGRATEPFLEYLSAFYRAAALTRLERVSDAAAAYRAAMSVVPHAQSATVGLAWLLFGHNRYDEASSVVEDGLGAGEPPVDPYAFYRYGDARLAPVFLERLRLGLR